MQPVAATSRRQSAFAMSRQCRCYASRCSVNTQQRYSPGRNSRCRASRGDDCGGKCKGSRADWLPLASARRRLAPCGLLLRRATRRGQVRLVVPFPPGNMSDLISRVLVEEMQARQRATLIVDNRAGATGAIGVQVVARAEPDGYTLLVSSNSPLTVNPAIRSDLPFDVMHDLAPIALLGWTGFLIVFSPDFPARTLAEAVAVM